MSRQALRVEQGPGPRADLPALRVFQQAQTLLGANGGLELPGQLLLQVVVIVVRDGVAGGAQQKHIVRVVVLHLNGEVLPVLMRNHVLPAKPTQKAVLVSKGHRTQVELGGRPLGFSSGPTQD